MVREERTFIKGSEVERTGSLSGKLEDPDNQKRRSVRLSESLLPTNTTMSGEKRPILMRLRNQQF
jgi:hypothetical protein